MIMLRLESDGRVTTPSGGAGQATLGYRFGEVGGVHTHLRWDNERVEITTDHVGSYPVYFAESEGITWLGTDAWEVAEVAGLRKINQLAAVGLLALEYVPGADTLIAGVSQLPVAHHITYSLSCDGWIRTERRYWRLERTEDLEGAPHEERLRLAEENLRELCEEIANDVRARASGFALNLSGGWDSRALLACLLPLREKGLFTCTYGDPLSSGVRAARQVAHALQLPNRYFAFESGMHLRDWHLQLCAVQQPVARYNLSDGGLAVSSSFYRGIAAASAGHSGDVFTGASPSADSIRSSAQLTSAILGKLPAMFRGKGIGALLRSEQRQLFTQHQEHLSSLVEETYTPGAAGPMRFKLEQRLRRLIATEVAVLEHFAPVVYTPMLDRRFIDFWGRLPADDLVDQRLYRELMRTRLFVDEAAPLATIPREGGTLLSQPAQSGTSNWFRKKLLSAGQRIAPGLVGRQIVTDPTAGWWRSDAELRNWAWTTLMRSDTIQELFDLQRLERVLMCNSPRNFAMAQTGIWSLLTIAGVELLLRNGNRPAYLPEST